jgi:ankyrin repeat protein
MISSPFAFLLWLVLMGILGFAMTVSPKRRRWRKRLLLVIAGIWLVSGVVFLSGFCNRKLLFKAIKSGESEQVRKLISENPKLIDARAVMGKTALHLAVESGNSNMVALLVEAGAEVNAKGDSVTPLHLAAFYGNAPIAETLIKAGAHVDALGYRHNDTPLHVAALHGHVNVVNLLLAHGADAGAENMLHKTALQLAQENQRTSVIAVLTKPPARKQ